MKQVIIGVIAIVILGGTAFALQNQGIQGVSAQNKVGATIFPIYDIAKQVAGDDFEVVLMLPSGASPHTFDPQPSLLRDLRGSQAVFAVGHGLDTWSNVVSESVNAPVITVDAGIDLRATEEGHGHHEEHGEGSDEKHAHEGHDHEGHDHDDHHEEHEHEHSDHEEGHEDHDTEHGHSHGPTDPHYWLSVSNAKQIAVNIAQELGELDNENAAVYMDRAERYVEALDVLESELQNEAAQISGRSIISFHDAWYYFADDFGLTIVGTFEPSAGKEPTPQYLARLQQEIDEYGVSTLFMEPQLSNVSIQAFANDNNLGIAVIDPLGGAENRNSYMDLMRYNVEQVVNALTN